MQVSGKPVFGMVSACCSTRHFFGWDSVQERCPTSTCNVGSCVSVGTTWCDSTTPCGPRHRGKFALFGEGMLPASASQRFWRFLSSCRAMSFWTWWAHISTRSTSFRKHSPSTFGFSMKVYTEPPWGRWSTAWFGGVQGITGSTRSSQTPWFGLPEMASPFTWPSAKNSASLYYL